VADRSEGWQDRRSSSEVSEMTQAEKAEQSQGPSSAGTAGVIALGVVLAVGATFAVVYEARAAAHGSWVPWLLALGPIVGLVVAWLGGPTDGAVNSPRAQATHFVLTGVMVVLLLGVVVLDGPSGLVTVTLVYCGGWWLALIGSLALWQQRRIRQTRSGSPIPRGVEDTEPKPASRPRGGPVVSDREISVRAFLRDLRWMLPLWVGVIVLLWLLDVGGMGDLKPIEVVLLPVGGVVVLGPMMWLVMEGPPLALPAKDPAIWKFLGGSVLWALVSGVAIGLVLTALGV
jgi:hypothetical protein